MRNLKINEGLTEIQNIENIGQKDQSINNRLLFELGIIFNYGICTISCV